MAGLDADGRHLSAQAIEALLRRVSEWQLRNLPDVVVSQMGRDEVVTSNGWVRSTFYLGMISAYEQTLDPFYLDEALRWANGNQWRLGPKERLADDHCAGQSYLKLFAFTGEREHIASVEAYCQHLMAEPKPGRKEWWWADACFMAAPVWAGLSRATGDPRYIRHMAGLFDDVWTHLYSPAHRLCYRDHRYLPGAPKGPALPGEAGVFWGRGNGWMFAALVRILQELGQERASFPTFLERFEAMTEGVLGCQGDDGLWRSNLLSPDAFVGPDTSASALFTFGLAWGHRSGLLPDSVAPMIERAWSGLTNAVEPEGRLGWVQPCGWEPSPVKRTDTVEFGVGALLMAGSELLAL